MRMSQISCTCSEIVLKSEDNESKIRSKIVLIKSDKVFAVCKGCGGEVEIPLQVNEEKANPPLFIKNYKNNS